MSRDKDYSQVPAGEKRPPVPSSLQDHTNRPRPDWSTSPDDASWWTVGPDGEIRWFTAEPERQSSYWSNVIKYDWEGWAIYDENEPLWWEGEIIDIPIGIDWRTLIEERPNVP